MQRFLAACAAALAGCSDATDGSTPPVPPGGISSVALPARRPVDGPRFRRLDAAVTGLDFVHELRPENLLPYLYSGAGLTVGDYDDDGLPDVYLVSQDGPNRLFRQTAPLRFEDVTADAGGLDGGDAWGTAASFVDLDGDGDLDLYVCNLESPNLAYRNDGDGTFTEVGRAWGIAIARATMGCAFADFDNDGDLDLYLLTNRVLGPSLPRELVDEMTLPGDLVKRRDELFPPYPKLRVEDGRTIVPPEARDVLFAAGDKVFVAGQEDLLLRNDGDGRWTDVTTRAGIAGHDNGLSCVWWDFDDDGWLDLYVANDLESPDRLYRNRGDGGFEEVTGSALPHTAYFGMGSDFGDIDNDGRLDLCVADMSSTSHFMSKMLMGNMADKRWFLMNADPPQHMRNALFVNTGTARFLEAAQMAHLASTDWTWTLRLVDLDEDGRLDFYASNGIPRYEDNPDTVAEFRRLWRGGRRDAALQLARDIPPVAEKNIARRNAGDLDFEDVGAAWGLDAAGVTYGAVFADLDRDGDLDLITNDLNAPAAVYENTTTDSRRILVALRGATSARHGEGARITLRAGGQLQTRLVSRTRGYMSAGEAVEHFGLGDATRIDELEVRWPSGRRQRFTDLDVDRLHTIWEAAADAPAALTGADAPPPTWFEAGELAVGRHREADFDDYAVQPLLPHRLSRQGPGIACGDIDGDGDDDLWIGGAAGQAGTLARNLGDGRFEAVTGPWEADAAGEDLAAVFLDYDADGDLDLFVVRGGIEAIDRPEWFADRLYVNDGSGNFTPAAAGTLPALRRSGSCVAAADFDRDGDVDLFLGTRVIPGRYPESEASVLLRNVGGRFEDATAELAPDLTAAGMVCGAVWTDIDDDGFVDLVVAAQWQPLRLLRNAGGDRLVAAGLTDRRGLWNGVTSADLDGDGRIELVATNLGLNTKYHADPDHPLRLYADDFDADERFDVVEAKTSGATLLPIRGLSCSSAAMPFLRERFPTFESFATATLPEIYGPDALAGSLQLQVDELRHMVLEPGSAAPLALPRRSQIAPGFGVVAADFDGDGWTDLFVAQNSFSPEPETGRFDGGLGQVLAGGPDGLAAIAPRDSGVVMPEDAVAAAVIDLDGDARPDVVCTTNDGPVRIFVNRAANPAPLAVRLSGPPGNPSGIGARLELRRADGRIDVREIQAGSGHLAQSAPVAFFAAADGVLHVRWPDGTRREYPVPEKVTTWTVSR